MIISKTEKNLISETNIIPETNMSQETNMISQTSIAQESNIIPEKKENMVNKRKEMTISKTAKMLIIELVILLLVLIIFIIAKTGIYTIFPKCIIKEFFGIDCPSCGATRCVVNFVTGNWKESFLYHPFFFGTILYLIIANIVYIINSIRKKQIITWVYPKYKFWIAWTIFFVIFAVSRVLLIKV